MFTHTVVSIQDNLLLDTQSLTCTSGTPAAYQVPDKWPKCVAATDCPAPTDHPDMNHDWTQDKGMMVGLSIK